MALISSQVRPNEKMKMSVVSASNKKSINDSDYAIFTEVQNESKFPNIDESIIYPY